MLNTTRKSYDKHTTFHWITYLSLHRSNTQLISGDVFWSKACGGCHTVALGRQSFMLSVVSNRSAVSRPVETKAPLTG